MTKNKESTRYFSTRQEEDVAKFLDGRRTANSGATLVGGGDVVVNNSILIECKTTEKEKSSFSIKKEWIDKSKKEATQLRMSNAVIAFRFSPDSEDYFVIDKKLMKFLVEKLKEDD